MVHKCIDCHNDISHKAKQARRCDKCAKIKTIKNRTRYNKANPDITHKAATNYRKRYPDRVLKQNLERVSIKRNWFLKSRYNVSLETWKSLFDSQGSLCAICRGNQPKAKGWNTDHNHITGKVRGILCAPCNWILGLASDNPAILENAINYLRND